MGIKNSLILFAICIIIILPFFPSVYAQDNVSVTIHMLGEDARTRVSNPVIVAGIWHYFNITLEDQASQLLILRFYQGYIMPTSGIRDETNYYEWKYNANIQTWTDEKKYGGYSYINETKCLKTGNTYSFCIGVKDTFPDNIDYYENWTLDIYKDGNQIHSENIVLEKPEIGLAKTHDDVITFNVEPFTEIDITNYDEYSIIENVGNVPLNIIIDYGIYNSIIQATNSNKKLSPGNAFDHKLTLSSMSWKPGILEISGNSKGSISSDLIITTTAITFETEFITNAANLDISVGHSYYKIEEIPGSNIVFQYIDELEMAEGNKTDLKVYISGEGIATLDISSDKINVAILKISSMDKEGTPMTISSTNTSEYVVTVTVEALRENKLGIITYELTVDGKTTTYTTSITIGPPIPKKESGEINIPTTAIFVGLCIIFVIGYMVYSQIRHKRR